MNNYLFLPVSLGEAIDKLSILDIKCDKITDNRINDVKKEYDLLYTQLKQYIEKYDELYATMKKINLIIWHQMDFLRDKKINDDEYLQLCQKCIESNDIRFRIKNKINLISNSLLKEQKSYKINRLIIEINKELINNVIFINITKYLSFIYDEIIFISECNLNYLKSYFEYDITIVFKFTNINEVLDYKSKVTISKEYTNSELYELFNITEQEINSII
jgi:hypothetical protein